MSRAYKPGGSGAATPKHATSDTNREHPAGEPSVDPPIFPLEALGEPSASMGRAVCATERIPDALAGCCLLAVISTAIGARLEIQSGPNRTTRGNLYIVVSAESGSGKSETYRHVMRPIQDIERETLHAWEANIRPDLSARRDVIESQISRIKKKAGGLEKPGRENAERELRNLKVQLQSVDDQLQAPALCCEDVSTEKLAVMLANNDEQLASMSADARAVVDNLLGRYTKGSATDESLYLKAYSGDSHRVDRLSRPPVCLAQPCLSILWMVQPDKVDTLFGNASLVDGGLLPRFLVCHTNAEPQEIGEAPPAIPPEVENAYHKLIKALLETYRLAGSPAVVQPTQEAWARLTQHFNRLVPRRKLGGDLHDVAGFAARWNEQAWRITACLHAAKHGVNAASLPVDLDTAERAIVIVDWFVDRQLEILSANRQKARQETYDKVLLLLKDQPKGITARDVQRARITSDAGSSRALLAEMEVAGKIAGRDVSTAKGGPQSRVYRRVQS